MVPMVQWLAEGASPSLGHGLPGWTPQTGGGWVMWGQLGEAGAGVPVWLPLHLMGDDMRAPPALLWAGCFAKQNPHAWCWRG